MNTGQSSRCLAVIVTYNPPLDRFSRMLRALKDEVDGVVIVENGSATRIDIQRAATHAGADFIWNTANLGLAHAQNQGISAARAQHANFILLMDQDTVLRAGTVARLRATYDALRAEGRKVAAVGPAFFEGNSSRSSTLWKSRGLRLMRIPQNALDEGANCCDFLISSGSLIPMEVIDEIGGPENRLFVDLIDVEWGLRAKAGGYDCYQTNEIALDHLLGEGRINLGRYSVVRHTPVRNYYWVRNATMLAGRRYIPLAWRLYFLRRIAAFPVVYPAFGDQKWKRLRMICNGIWDGIRQHTGRAMP